jgi:anti-anti-sigma factor
MRSELQIRDGISILRLEGRFSIGSEVEFHSALSQLRESGIVNVILDLGGVPYMDSTGLAFVVDLHKALKRSKGQLFLVGANPRVQQVLALTRIAEIIPVYDCEDAALAAFEGEVLC